MSIGFMHIRMRIRCRSKEVADMEKYEKLIIETIEFFDEDIITNSDPDARTDNESIPMS